MCNNYHVMQWETVHLRKRTFLSVIVEPHFDILRLTAFVLRSFAKAKSFIHIDPKNIEQSKTWLESKQRENGCFQQLGKLFNNRMKVSWQRLDRLVSFHLVTFCCSRTCFIHSKQCTASIVLIKPLCVGGTVMIVCEWCFLSTGWCVWWSDSQCLHHCCLLGDEYVCRCE